MEKYIPKTRSFLANYKKQIYVKEYEEPVKVVVDCALGVNPFGCSPKVSAMFKDSNEPISLYPEYPYMPLRLAISRYWNETASVAIKEIRVGAGSMSILDLLCKCMLDPGDRVLGNVPQFPDFSTTVLSYGGVYETFPMNAANGFELNVDEFCAAIKSEHKIVYIDNPNNPTGQVFPLDVIAKLASVCRERGALLIVDEAYADYLDNKESSIALFPKHENLCVLRTFSKGFGLASMRVGYSFLHEPLAGIYDKVSCPFVIPSLGAILAEEALLDEDFLISTRKAVAETKGELLSSLKRFKAARTHPQTPIFTLLADEGVSLQSVLSKNGVSSESGGDFANLGEHAVRLRIPKETEPLISILQEVERELF